MLNYKMLLLVLLSNLCLHAQTSIHAPLETTLPKIFFLGVKEFDDLVVVESKFHIKENEKINNMKFRKRIRKGIKQELTHITVEKENIDIVLTAKNEDFKYLFFDSNCYVIIWGLLAQFSREYIIPNAPDSYLPILNKTYPNIGVSSDKEINNMFNGEDIYLENYIYTEIAYNRFLVVLVHLPLYNEYRSTISPAVYLLPGEKAENGMYVKVLIPIMKE